MPVNNALAESISTGQSEDPFKRVLEYGQLGNQASLNRLRDAQIGAEGASAARSMAEAANARERTKYVGPEAQARITLQGAETGSANARTAVENVNRDNALLQVTKNKMDIGGRIATSVLNGNMDAGEAIDAYEKGTGETVRPDVKAHMLANPEFLQRWARQQSGSGLTAEQAMQPRFPPTGSGESRIGQTLAAPTPAAPAGALATQPVSSLPQNTPAMSPREKTGQAGMGTADEKFSTDVSTQAAAARTENTTLDNMRRDAQALEKAGLMGPGMEKTRQGAALLQSFYDNNVLGAKSWMHDPGSNATAAYQDMEKNAGALTRQTAMAMHDRAAYAMPMISKTLPGGGLTGGGFDLVTSEMQGMNDAKLAKEQAMAKQPVAGRSDKFSAEWNKNVDPSYFIIQRMSPEHRDRIAADLQKTPEGQRVIASWKQTRAYLAANGGQ
jgi:hypothetical protein